MEIIRLVEGLGFKVVGKRCDSCKRDWRSYRSLDQELEMFEFTRIEVHAGYMAVRFVDGDRLVADLCQYCTHARLGKILRHLGNQFEIPATPEQIEEAEDLWIEALYGRERPQTVH
ncbi:MAG: hypothetical protein ACT4PZ_14125 [Panacagrimonas sp.]